MLTLRHLRIVTPYTVIENGYIAVEQGRIVSVGNEPLESKSSLNGKEETVDLHGYTALPGFVDTHTHGIGGKDANTVRTPEQLLEMGKHYARHGVTSYVPTTVSDLHENLLRAAELVRAAHAMWSEHYGARILGLHLEGPYLNLEVAGAQNPTYLRKPSVDEFRELVEASGGLVRQITLAPEIEGALELIRYIRREHPSVVISAGHTNATYSQGLEAIKAGVAKATHIFNGMRRFHHREPGIAFAFLDSSETFIEVINDFIHLHPALVRHIVRVATPRRVVAVSDSISATDLPDGEYELGGLRVIVKGGVCMLADKDSLAGSTLTMDRAFRNLVELGFSLSEASMMTSTTPVRSIDPRGELKIGELSPGYYADIVILDEKLNVAATMINGEIVYSNGRVML